MKFLLHVLGAFALVFLSAGVTYSGQPDFQLESHCSQYHYCRTGWVEVPQANQSARDKCRPGQTRDILPADINECEQRLRSGELDPHVKAEIHFYLALAYSAQSFVSRESGKQAWQQSLASFDAAIAADPEFAEPYLSAGLVLMQFGQADGALKYYNAGLAQVSGSARLKAAKAKALLFMHDRERALELCDGVSGVSAAEPVAAHWCGDVFESFAEFEKAATAYRKATQGYKPMLRRIYGMVQNENPYHAWARALKAGGRSLEAAEAMTAYFSTVKPEQLEAIDYVMRADYLSGAGRHALAAEDYGKAAELPQMLQPPQQLRLLQMFSLVQAGERQKARKVADRMFGNGALQQILQVQVLLRNAGFDEVVINGKFDDATEKALERCIGESTCLSEFVGQRA